MPPPRPSCPPHLPLSPWSVHLEVSLTPDRGNPKGSKRTIKLLASDSSAPSAPPQGLGALPPVLGWHRPPGWTHLRSQELGLLQHQAPRSPSRPAAPALPCPSGVGCPSSPPGEEPCVAGHGPQSFREVSVFPRRTCSLFLGVFSPRLCGGEDLLCHKITEGAFISPGSHLPSSLTQAVQGYSLHLTFMSQNSMKLLSAWGSRAFQEPGKGGGSLTVNRSDM